MATATPRSFNIPIDKLTKKTGVTSLIETKISKNIPRRVKESLFAQIIMFLFHEPL